MTIRHLDITRWIPKVIDTRSEYVILIAFPYQPSLFEGSRMLRYTCAASLINMDFS
jgi:hypothetical protein